MVKKENIPALGRYLKEMRERKGLSQFEVAQILDLNSAQSVSDWERNHGSAIPVKSLKKLIKTYGMSADKAYELLLQYQMAKLEAKISEEFYGKASKKKKS